MDIAGVVSLFELTLSKKKKETCKYYENLLRILREFKMKKQSGPLGGMTQKVRQGCSAARWEAAQPTEPVSPLSQAAVLAIIHLLPTASI